jgi:3-hydroxyacyl-[acyl-carrier-protein] dehydratase
MASPEKINIPQAPPMIMVDELLTAEGAVTETLFAIRPENVFVENGFFTEPGLIENMAQTAAAGAGAKPGEEGKKARTGFIGGIRNLKIHSLPATGDMIRTRVTLLHTVFEASVIRAEVFKEEILLAECEMKIFQV